MQSLARFRPLSILSAGIALAASTTTVAFAQGKKNKAPPAPSPAAVEAYDYLVEVMKSEESLPIRTAFSMITEKSPCAIPAAQTYLYLRDSFGSNLEAFQKLDKCTKGEQYQTFVWNEKDTEIRKLLGEPGYVLSSRALIDRFLHGPFIADQTIDDLNKDLQ